MPAITQTATSKPLPSTTVIGGDAVRELRALPSNSVHSVVSDPPYAIDAIGDFAAPFRSTAQPAGEEGCEQCSAIRSHGYTICLSCLAEAEIAAFAHAGMLGQQSQNWHDKATHSRGFADNDPQQFERWCLLWLTECHRVLKPGGHLVLFGGTRTWHRLAVAVEDAGFEIRDSLAWLYASGFPKSVNVAAAIERHVERQGVTGDDAHLPGGSAAHHQGWGTALKPAHEPIVLARKPLAGTVAQNVLAVGTGGLNIDATRLEDGRWPSNVFLDAHQSRQLDTVSGSRSSRFFWEAKPDQSERVRVDGVSHPTVKPLSLMRELVRLVTPVSGIVLDPFAGSGTTAEACLLEGLDCIVIERDPSYLPLIEQRLHRRTDPVRALTAPGEDPGLFEALIS